MEDYRDFSPQETRNANLRWETCKLLERFGTNQANRKATFVWTPSFPEPRPFFVQVFFASALDGSTTGTYVPALPFQPFSSARMQVTIQRYVDDFGAALVDSYIINGFNPSTFEPAWLPVAIVMARKIVVTVEIIDETPGHVRQWVDASVALVETIDTEQIIQSRYASSANGENLFLPNVFGFGDVPQVVRTPQDVVPQLLLPADQTRRQFWITNEGDSRLAVKFGRSDPSVTAGAESWDIILDPKGGPGPTSYQSIKDAHWGEVRGIWEAAGGGFALASGAVIE
jgi:hypothetical protein